MVDAAGASRPRRSSHPRSKVVPARTVPNPPAVLHITPATWEAGAALHRVHLAVHAAASFNPGVKGNARFSPIVNAAGKPIPTLYGGTSFACAAMETVFHDVPFVAGLKTFARQKLEGQLHSVLVTTAALTLADLRNVPLRKLGVERKRLIDTEKDSYGQTRKWAEAIHAQHAHVQGLCWTSRQDDRAMAIMLFGDRIDAGVLTRSGISRGLLDDEPTYMELLTLADMIGVYIVPGRA